MLICDLNGRPEDIRTVVEAQPDILNHNVETVPRLQRAVRRRAKWDRSVSVLTQGRAVAAEIGFDEMVTKTGIMLGLGESRDEICRGHAAAARSRCRGAHDRPIPTPVPAAPAAGEVLHAGRVHGAATHRLEMGFKHVQSGPLVRSSYHAAEQVPGRETAAAV